MWNKRRVFETVLQSNVPSISLPAQMINSSRVIETFETAVGFSNSNPGAGATVTNNTDQKLYGTQSVKFTTPSGSNFYSVKTINENFAADFAAGRDSFRFPIYSHDANGSYVIVQFASNTNLNPRFYNRFDVATAKGIMPAAMAPGWDIVSIHYTDMSEFGDDDWNNPMIRMAIYTGPAAGVVASFSYDNFMIVDGVPGVMLMFDDGGASIYNSGFPYMRSKQVVGTCYIISSLIDDVPHTYLTSAQLVELNAAGWDMANHSSDGVSFTTLTQAQIETNLSTCKTFLDNLGLTRASNHVAYPGGNYDQDTLAAMAAQSMLTGRETNNKQRPTLPFGQPPYQQQLTKLLDNNCSLAQAKAVIDAAVTKGEICSFLCHGLAETASAINWAIADFQALIDYIRQVQIQTLTISEYYALNSAGITVRHY